MIKNRTVLVLGAGASKPYGYPLGQELVNKIVSDAMNPGSYLDQVLGLCHIPEISIKTLGTELKASARPSIDAFLESRTDLLPVGRLAIAVELLFYEESARIHATDDWYQYLFNKMCAPSQFESFGTSKVSIVTFNYDRSLEFCLFTALRKSFQKSVAECVENFERIPIIHVHGRIGPSPTDEKLLPYGTPMSPAVFQDFAKRLLPDIAKQIRIIHEVKDDMAEFKAAQTLLSQAERICFLGFGFHETNLRRLFKGITTLEDPTQTPNSGTWRLFSGVKIFAHNFDFTESEKKDIQRLLPRPTCDWRVRKQSCKDFLRESGVLLD
jgi:hypothetical protein